MTRANEYTNAVYLFPNNILLYTVVFSIFLFSFFLSHHCFLLSVDSDINGSNSPLLDAAWCSAIC